MYSDRKTPYTRNKRNFNSVWKHDLFQDASHASERDFGTRIKISNLHPNVTKQDIRTTFESFGRILELQMLPGVTPSAVIVYEKRSNAMDAIEAYHDKLTDGYVLNVVETNPVKGILGASKSIGNSIKQNTLSKKPISQRLGSKPLSERLGEKI